MVERTIRTGRALHARPLDQFVRLARRHGCAIRLAHGAKSADGRNVTQLLLLGIPAGAEVRLSCDGPGELEAIAALAGLLTGAEPHAEPPPAPLSATATGIHSAVVPRLVLEWTPGAPGIGVGRLRRAARPVVEPGTPPLPPAEERARLERALASARTATDALIGGEDDPFCDIFRAQRTLLEDPALAQGLLARLEAAPLSAEGAVVAEFAAIEARFSELGTVFAAERHADVADVRDRILEALGISIAEGLGEEERIVLVLREATPSRMAVLDLARIAAVISERGGPTSHAAIVARGRGIPLVFARGETAALDPAADGERLMVDGTNGVIAWLGEFQEPAAAPPPERAGVALGPARTADGERIYLRANLGAPGDLGLARQNGCDGCGLLRSELLFAGRRDPPTIEEQARAYERVAIALAPSPTVVRLFDAGSDKPLAFLPAPGDEPNPALGRRGVRLLLAHPEILGAQLEAVALARHRCQGAISALVPMVSDLAQLDRVLALAPRELPVGVMIETPAAVLLARSLASRAAFVSVGSNDLYQYLLARDRTRASGGAHPALIRAIALAVREARARGATARSAASSRRSPRRRACSAASASGSSPSRRRASRRCAASSRAGRSPRSSGSPRPRSRWTIPARSTSCSAADAALTQVPHEEDPRGLRCRRRDLHGRRQEDRGEAPRARARGAGRSVQGRRGGVQGLRLRADRHHHAARAERGHDPGGPDRLLPDRDRDRPRHRPDRRAPRQGGLAMAILTILGAGYMGSALAVVAAERGHEVRLWGTWLDDALVEPVQRGEPHPRLKLRLPAGIRALPSSALAEALAGADAVVCAVNSDGVLPVLERALAHLPARAPLLSVTKGFLPGADGRIARISVAVRERLLRPAGREHPWVAIGGPCKAMEVARRVPTAVVYASEPAHLEVRDRAAAWLEGETYMISRSADLAGVEACSAFKNAYATASGLCDGLQLRGHPEMYNLKALLFAQAIREIARMVIALGGRAEAAHGLPGVGDLHVTAAAGRNRAYGERVGLGQPPSAVADAMREQGELTEGYPALETGYRLLEQLGAEGRLARAEFPLLDALHAIVYRGAEVAATLAALRVHDA